MGASFFVVFGLLAVGGLAGILGGSDSSTEAETDGDTGGSTDGGTTADIDGENLLLSDFADILETGAGDDTILAGAGDDSIITGDGDDAVRLGAGDDHWYDHNIPNPFYEAPATYDVYNSGDDTVSGGLGADHLTSSSGSDMLDGGFGDDNLSSIDSFAQGVGRDANDSPDTLIGGAGDDSLDGDAGDVLIGGEGSDRFSTAFIGPYEATETLVEDQRAYIEDFDPQEDRILIDFYNGVDASGDLVFEANDDGTGVVVRIGNLVFLEIANVDVAELADAYISIQNEGGFL